MKTKIEIPYTNYDKYKLLYAYINGVRAQFILNLSQKETVLNSIYFYSKDTLKQHGRKVPPVYIARFSVYGIQLNEHSFKVDNLSDYEQFGKTIYGVIGRDIFTDRQVEINHLKQVVTVIPLIHENKKTGS